MARNGPFAALARPAAYLQEIERLERRRGRAGQLGSWRQRGLSLGAAAVRRRELARLLARTVASGRYAADPLLERTVAIEGKPRTLYCAGPIDAVVQAAVARALGAAIQPFLSGRVYSYQKGRSALQAIRAFSAYLETHGRERPDPRARGLYVVQRDIARYGESIPVDPRSALWSLLREALAAYEPLEKWVWPLVEAQVRPRVRDGNGAIDRLRVGVPTGSAIQPVLCNLYLTPIDRELASVPGGFSARYGDDLLFAHPDAAAAAEAARAIDRAAAGLGLATQDDKRRFSYFTGPGRPSRTETGAEPVRAITYLGCRIAFDGAIGLKREKGRRLLSNLDRRMRAGLRLLDPNDLATRAEVVCRVASAGLDPQHPLADPSAPLLRYAVNDRAQLKALDYRIALACAEAATGVRGVRAFRRLPYRTLRRRHGLRSLVTSRNEKPGRRGAGR